MYNFNGRMKRIVFWGAAVDEVSFFKDNLARGPFSVGVIFIRVTLRDAVLYQQAVFQAAIFWEAIFLGRYLLWGAYLFIYLFLWGRAVFRKTIFLGWCSFTVPLRKYMGWEYKTFKEKGLFQNIFFCRFVLNWKPFLILRILPFRISHS